MFAPSIQIVFDAADPEKVAAFWKEALGYAYQDPPEGYTDWQTWLDEHGIVDDGSVAAIVDPAGIRPRIYIQRVPEAKQVKNRLHLDIAVEGARGADASIRRQKLETEAERLIAFGATKVEFRDDEKGSCIVMQDPEGNEFCLH